MWEGNKKVHISRYKIQSGDVSAYSLVTKVNKLYHVFDRKCSMANDPCRLFLRGYYRLHSLIHNYCSICKNVLGKCLNYHLLKNFPTAMFQANF